MLTAAAVAVTAACTAHATDGAPQSPGSTTLAAPHQSSKTVAPTALTVAQVTALAERDLVLLVHVDYRHLTGDYALAEAQLTPELKREFIAEALTSGPDVRGQMQTRAGLINAQVVETLRTITSVTTEKSDPAYPAATLRFTVDHKDNLSYRPYIFPARVRLTFAHRSGRWLVANEEMFPVR
jgi:hypothetical protein